ncbi:MAG: sulfurtransferase [Bacteroidetes bacterium]|jgi:thiosulfate/3-mercaptopyruvate sulfurtransferase|nr:sulfurtransferase [Bacteroidota bacterium]MBT6685629.1 sulfurtransferase [Bacteroidota bacterium]MBT7141848.1 sulfurtransferase [Bacteroidota bacterium]
MKIKIFLLTLIFILPFFISAQDVISVKDASKLTKDANTVIVACVKPESYQKVHITNSVNIYHKDLYNNEPVKSMLKPAGELAKIFGEKGLTTSKQIILYDKGTYKYAGRIYWILKYMGAENVKIIDGNFDGWRKGRKPVTKNPSKVKPATFTPKVNKAAIASLSDVKVGKAMLIDVRPVAEFNGSEGKTEKLGHIPNAVNFHFEDVIAIDGKIKPKAELVAMFNKAGITANKEIILYCTSSVRAGVVYMALTSILGNKNVKVYDGGVYEWLAKGNKVVK